jgi:hypothetical protein
MFEAASMGISFSAVNDSISFVEETPPPEQSELLSFVSQHQILICYESLYPRNWQFKKQTLVLTNHHLFNNFRLMDWVYIGMLRQFSFLFQSQTKLVANAGQSGLLSGNLNFSDTQEKSAENHWTVIEID